MWRLLIKTGILLALTTHTNTQYADFFSSLNTLLQPFATTKRHDVTKRPEHKHKQTHKHKHDDIIYFQTDDEIKANLEPVHSSKKKTSHTTSRPKNKNLNSNIISNSRNTGVIRSISNSNFQNNYNNDNINRESDNRENNWNFGTTSNPNKQNERNNRPSYETSNSNRQTTKNPGNSWNIGTTSNPNKQNERNNRPSYETSNSNRQTTKNPGNSWNIGTTSNPNRQNERNNRPSYERSNSNRQTTNNPGNWNLSNRQTTDNNFGNWYGTTSNPLLNRPGVKPAVVDENKPPITNKPVTVRPYDKPVDTGTYRPVNTRPPYENDRQNFNSRPANTRPPFGVESLGTTKRPSTPNRPGTTDREPIIEVGPDEDDMSEAEKRRYYEICEQKCSEYKSANIKKVVALPLAGNQRAEFNVSSCTRANVPLIIGGQVVDIKQYPHMALIGWKKLQAPGYSWKCGGSLVSEQHILTAGHCTYYDKDDQIVSGVPQAVQLGSSQLDGRDGLVVSVSTVIRHPKYKFRRSYYDVAIIKLQTTVSFSEKISPACLGVPPRVGEPIIATGWGKTEFGGDNSLELRSVSLPIWDMGSCREVWGSSRKLPQGVLADSQICAGEPRGGKDTCQGDSGGPAQIQDGCSWRIVAITSVGRSCGAPETPALYATIPRAFIASQIYSEVKTNRGSGGTGDNRGNGNSNRRTESNVWGISNSDNSNRGTNNNRANENSKRGTEGNVWGVSNNGGIGANNNRGTENTNRGSGNNQGNSNGNRGTESNVWGVSNSGSNNNQGSGISNRGSGNYNQGSVNVNRGTESNVWGVTNSDRGSNNNNGATGSNVWGVSNSNNNAGIGSTNRGTESNVWGISNSDNRGNNNNRGTENNNWGTVNSATANRAVETAWGVNAATTNNYNNNNRRPDSWVTSNSGVENNNSGNRANVRPGINVQNNNRNQNNEPKTTIGNQNPQNYAQNSQTSSPGYYNNGNIYNIPVGVPWWT